MLPPRDRAGLTIGGPLARHAVDVAAYLTAVAGPVGDAAAPMPARPIVAWSATLGIADIYPEIAAVAAGALQRLADWVEITDVPVQLRDPQEAWQTLRAHHAERQQIEIAHAVRRDNDDRLRRLFRQVDLLATPTTPSPPHGHDGPGHTVSVALTWGFNLSGHPAISVPAGLTQAGAPVGLQLIARPGSEQLLVTLAGHASIYIHGLRVPHRPDLD